MIDSSMKSTNNSHSLKKCLHDIIHHGLCAICGIDLTVHDPDVLLRTVNISQGSLSSILISQEEARRLEKETARRLLKEKRLSLVVDLDQTLLHASMNQEIGQWISQKDHKYHENCKNVHQVKLHDHSMIHYIKLRHGALEFLEKVHKMYELHIYTMGSRSYAEAIARLLDPQQYIFNDRIVARDHHGNWTKKELTRIFPCDDTMVVILDDRLDVWERSPNLVQVKPYEFFINAGDINTIFKDEQKAQMESMKPIISPTPLIIDEADDQLERIVLVLEQVHGKFYELYDQKISKKSKGITDTGLEDYEMDIKVILPLLRSPILTGCHIIFSGLIPLQTDSSLSDIWRISTDFGAVCSQDIRNGTTHLVTSTMDSEKAKQAQKKGNVWIVKPGWLYSSAWRWKRADEMEFIWSSKCIPMTNTLASDFENEELEFKNNMISNIIPMTEALKEDETFLNTLSDEETTDTSSIMTDGNIFKFDDKHDQHFKRKFEDSFSGDLSSDLDLYDELDD